MSYLVFNPGGLGDCFVGSNLCSLIKQHLPHKKTIFIMSKDAYSTIGDIIRLQPNIDHIGYEKDGGLHIENYDGLPIDKAYIQANYYTDLSYYQSLIIEFIKDHGLPLSHNSAITYKLPNPKILPNRLTVAVNDLSDWKRKRPYDIELKIRVENLLKDKYGAQCIEIGQDSGLTYLESVKILNNCHLYLGFFGSLSIFASGINVDTITYPAVMPINWASSAFYSNGWHRHVLAKPENHCKSYKCIIPRSYYFNDNAPVLVKDKLLYNYIGAPVIENTNDLFTETCRHMPSGKSCISTMTLEDIDKELESWVNNRWTQK